MFSISNCYKKSQQRHTTCATGVAGLTSSVSRDPDGSKQI